MGQKEEENDVIGVTASGVEMHHKSINSSTQLEPTELKEKFMDAIDNGFTGKHIAVPLVRPFDYFWRKHYMALPQKIKSELDAEINTNLSSQIYDNLTSVYASSAVNFP